MSKKIKILLVVESIDLEDSSGSKANVALIKNLQLAGYDLKLYHYTLKQIQMAGISCYAIKENRKSILFFLSRAERYLRDYFKIKLYKPLQNIFGFSFTLFNDRNSIVKELKSINNYEPDLVLTLSKGGSFRPHHALLKIPKWHHKWMAYMHDPYPMHHYPKPFTWTEPGYEKKEKFIKEISINAAYSAFPSLLLKDWMGHFYPGFLNSGIIIPHQIANLEMENTPFPDYFDPAKFNLLHAGNLFGARDPKVLLVAFKQFLKSEPTAKKDARLIFLGSNNQRIRKAAESLANNIYASSSNVDFKTVFSIQMATTVNIILEARAELSPFLPGKFPHCIQANKPILLLGPEKSEARRLLGKNYSYWSPNDDKEKIFNLIKDLYQQWSIDKNLKLNRPDIKEYLSEGNLKTILDQIL